MVAEAPEAFSGFFSKLQEPESVVKRESDLITQTPRGIIRMLTPTDAQERYDIGSLAGFPVTPYFLGFAVQVDDLELVGDYLNKNSIPCKLSDGLIRVLPKDAFGALIEFRK